VVKELLPFAKAQKIKQKLTGVIIDPVAPTFTGTKQI
jgi:hypothetical protein